MKKTSKLFALGCCAMLALSASACSFSKATLLKEPAEALSLTYREQQDETLVAYRKKVEEFAAKWTAASYQSYSGEDNFAVAPISIFMALSMAAECAAGQTRTEILDVLGVDYAQLKTNTPTLFRSLTSAGQTQTIFGKQTTERLSLSNSIWLTEDLQPNGGCLDNLAQYYYTHSYEADFVGENEGANAAIRKFVKDKTEGLIDQNFSFPQETLFALINTLYLKDTWLDDGKKLPLTDKEYAFIDKADVVKNLQLLAPGYTMGNVYDGGNFTSFYAETHRGYKLKFILPKTGYTIDEVFTADNILLANSVTDYGATDHEQKIHYHTRCLFPQFNASYDNDEKSTLQAMGVRAMFDKNAADFTSLSTYKPLFCDSVRHVTKLTVDRVGIEGAAVTILRGAGAPGPDGYENVYQDFLVDKTFGFVLTNRYDTTLFAGVIDNV